MARKMKDSGVEWIGEIPENWEVKPLKQILIERKEKNDPIKTNEILSLSIERGVFPYSEKVGGGNKAKEDLSAYKLAYPDDIVLNSMNVIVGAVGLSKYFGCVSPVYYTLYPRTSDYDIHYYSNIFQSSAFQKSLMGYGNGIMMKESDNGKLNTIRMRIPMEKLNTVMLPIPTSRVEQKKIAEFLDEKVGEIGSVIAKTKETIEDYKKYKQAIITDAVTKGLNPNAEMKESGIDYLKIMPCHWRIIPISIAFDFVGGYAYKSEKFCGETPYQVIRLGNVKNDNFIIEEKRVFIDEEYAKESEKCKIFEDDILFTMTGTKGKKDYFYTLIVKSKDLQKRELFLNQRVGCFRKAINEVFMPYYNYLLKYENICDYIFLFETGTANQGNIGIEAINTTKLLLPPIEEQKEIAEYLDEKCSEIDKLITKKEELLVDLENYKKSLIYEYVTGKKEVE